MKKILAISILVILAGFILSQITYAVEEIKMSEELLKLLEKKEAPKTELCKLLSLVKEINKVLRAIAAVVAALMIIVGGYYLITATGKPESIDTGRKIILWALIGFAIVLVATLLLDTTLEVIRKAVPGIEAPEKCY